VIIKVACEGLTEKGLRPLLERITPSNVHIETRSFTGVNNLLDSIRGFALESFGEGTDVVFWLVDLVRSENFPFKLKKAFEKQYNQSRETRKEELKALWNGLDIPSRERWLKSHLYSIFAPGISEEKLRLHFAVHDVEAWMIADRANTEQILKIDLSEYDGKPPEEINDNKPPADVLREEALNGPTKSYIKTAHGKRILSNLNHDLVSKKCPHFKEFIEDIKAVSAQPQP
jgi:hypothetical protein